MASEFFRNYITPIIKANEGGYVNDPDDPGGETNHGWTVGAARANGYTGSMKNMTWQTAEDLYEKVYFIAPGFNNVADISPHLAVKLTDIGINMGIKYAAKFLQRGLNVLNRQQQDYPDVLVDGDIGEKTIEAIKSLSKARGLIGLTALEGAVQAQQYVRYMEIAEANPRLEKFMFGWFIRAGQ